MLTSAHARMMARYNRWQNESLYGAADGLSDAARKEDRGAFFRSIHETLAHILWADEIWLSRFGACDAPPGDLGASAAYRPEWADLATARKRMDALLVGWADGLAAGDLDGDLTWWSGAAGRELSRPRWVIVAHVFNHQTHHRGQVHAMLTAAGARPEATDIPFMPS